MSKISANTLRDKDGAIEAPMKYPVQGSAKSRASVNQTGTQAINASLNVTSITDTGAGQTAFNFTSNFSNGNFSMTIGSNRASSVTNSGDQLTTRAVSSAELNHYESASGLDTSRVEVVMVGDLA